MLGLIVNRLVYSIAKKMVLPFYEDKGVLELIIEKIVTQVPQYKINCGNNFSSSLVMI
jgi:hypothetical protein